MMRKPIVLVTLLLALAAAAVHAQALESLPGYVPIEKLGLFPPDKLSVEINLVGPMLHMAAAATKSEDPAFSAVLAGLKSIRVQVFPLKGVDAAAIKVKVDGAARWLEARGWQSTLKVRDQGQETYIYLKETNGKVEGLTLLSVDPKDEAVIVNIVGRIDPAQLGSIAQGLNVKMPAAGTPRKPDAKKPE
jgi:Domain of unknown function (DUF4252)